MQTLKSLFVTLLILGGAFLAYDYYLAPHQDKMVFKTSPYPAVSATAAKPAPNDAPTGPAALADRAPSPAGATDQPQPGLGAAAAQSKPASGLTAALVPEMRTGPPGIPDVAKATANWTRIPPSAFPRPAKLKVPLEFKGPLGSTKLPAGSQVVVVAAKEGWVQLAPTQGSPFRASVVIDGTDLKETLTTVYEAWRVKRAEEVKRAAIKAGTTPAPDASTMLAADGSPQQAADGTYPLLTASMRSGDVTEVTPPSVRKWGKPEQGTFKGKPCWIVAVEYDAQTAFGKLTSEALARVADGRVMGWYYKGSDEPVP